MSARSGCRARSRARRRRCRPWRQHVQRHDLVDREMASPTGSGASPLRRADSWIRTLRRTPTSRRRPTEDRPAPLGRRPSPHTALSRLLVPIVMPLCCRPPKPPSSTHKQLGGHRPSRLKVLRPAGFMVGVRCCCSLPRGDITVPVLSDPPAGPPVFGGQGGHPACCGSGGAGMKIAEDTGFSQPA